MKTVVYNLMDGGKRTIEYDETAPCIICGEPVIEASTGGTVICPWCDMGKCRYCGITISPLKEAIDGGRSLREVREHMTWHKGHSRQVTGLDILRMRDEGLLPKGVEPKGAKQ